MSTKYEFDLIPLSYIHIGSGEKLEPISYVIKDGYLYYINQGNYIDHLISKEEDRLYQILDECKLHEISQYLANSFDEKNRSLWITRYKFDKSIEYDLSTLYRVIQRDLFFSSKLLARYWEISCNLHSSNIWLIVL